MRVRIPIAATLAAVMALGSLSIDRAAAAPVAPLQKAAQFSDDNAGVIQVASKKKRRHRGNNAAAAAAFAGIAGAMIGLAAQDSYRRRYDGYDYGYGYAPRYRSYGHGYRGNRVYYGRGRAAPVNRHGLLPNNLPVGNDPLNADPYGR